MRKLRQGMLSTFALLFAAGTMKPLQAQYRVPGASAPRPITTTFTSLVYGAPPSYLWIQVKWGPGRDDFVRPEITATTSLIFQNGQAAPKTALCPTPSGPNCGNVHVQVTGFYYGSLGIATRFYATKIVILPTALRRSPTPHSASSGYRSPTSAQGPPMSQGGPAGKNVGVVTRSGTIEALRPGYFELSSPGRAALWVRDIGARITEHGRLIGSMSLRVGESVEVQGRTVGAQLWADGILVSPSATEPNPSVNNSPLGRTASASPSAPSQHAGLRTVLKQQETRAYQADRKFLAYQVKFQLGQVDRHINLLNALMRNSTCAASCRSALENGLASANQVKLTLKRTTRPISNLSAQLRHFVPPRELSGGPTHSPRGGRLGGGSSSAGGGASGCTAPQISSLSTSQGQPGDPIMINGSGFTNQAHPQMRPSVTMILAGTSYMLGVAFINDSQVLVEVPGPIGLQAQTSYIYLSTCQNSNAVPFEFEPEISVVQLPIQPIDASFANFTCGIDGCGSSSGAFGTSSLFPQFYGLAIDAIHAGIYTGRRGDDQFFSGYQLKNGWVLDSVSFTPFHTATSGNGCTLEGDTIGSTSPFADVHCWVSPFGTAGYVLAIYIHGPKGVSYQ